MQGYSYYGHKKSNDEIIQTYNGRAAMVATCCGCIAVVAHVSGAMAVPV